MDKTSVSNDNKYPIICEQAATNDLVFKNFKRHPDYKRVLEHLSYELGKEYLEIIKTDLDVFKKIKIFVENDKYGKPLQGFYKDFGYVSPTTLSYVKHLIDFKTLFNTSGISKICELGIGYGGLCRIYTEYFKPVSYTLVDLDPVLNLSERFLSEFDIGTKVRYKAKDQITNKTFSKVDLLISNYAFSELNRELQEFYLDKVILKSKRGYMICNEISPPYFNSFTKAELLKRIKGSRVIKETPKTHPNNYVIVWGTNEQ